MAVKINPNGEIVGGTSAQSLTALLYLLAKAVMPPEAIDANGILTLPEPHDEP